MTKEETLENTLTVDTTTKRMEKRTETHTCDYISRQVAIDAMQDMYHAAEKWGEEASDDVIKARAESCMASLIEMKLRIEKLPSARRKGKWKYEKMKHILNGEVRTVRICSECNGGWFRYDLSDGVEDVEPNYCPNCGARMMKGEEDE